MSVTLNRVRRGFYADSVALMRISRVVSALPGLEAASLMIGTPSNRDLLSESELLDAEAGRGRLQLELPTPVIAQAIVRICDSHLYAHQLGRNEPEIETALQLVELLLGARPQDRAVGPAPLTSDTDR